MTDDELKAERKAFAFWMFWGGVASISIAIGKLTDTAYGILSFGIVMIGIFILCMVADVWEKKK